MRRDVQRLCLRLSLIACGFAGCQQRTNPTPPVKSAPAMVTDAGGAANSQPSPDQIRESEEPVPAPVAAVKTLLSDVEAGKLESLADFLPESYVQDLESLLQSAVKKTPDDVWQRLHAIVGKVAQLSEQRPDLFVGESPANQQHWKGVLSILADDAAWDRTQVKDADLRKLLQTASAKLRSARQPEASSNATLLSQTNVRLEKTQGDQATLTLQSPLDKEPRSVEFVLVDGKWIPKSLADAWPATIGKVLHGLNSVSDGTLAEISRRLGPALLQIEGTLDQMLKAEQPEEVQLGWWQIQSLLVQARQDLFEPGPPPRVELQLAGDVSDEQLTKLLEQLVEIADVPEVAEYLTFPSATGTVIQLSPVADFDEFVKRLTFVVVKSADAGTRRAEIELKTDQ